jgi:dihydrofolate synthase/folylpolyglutamate synthase
MRFESLDEWLAWQESLNPKAIDLGLERVSRVLELAGHNNHFACPLITVAGTNGKGSVVAYLEAIAQAAGYKTCAYTSPHLLRYNERIRINGREIDDDSLCHAFERIDQARQDIELTYFEFGTLAAIDLFMAAQPDIIIMEIGLGGRLDAVNIMEPDVAVITTIAIDHTDWLGSDRDSIGFEKAGIFRKAGAAVCGDADPPQSLLKRAAELQVDLKLLGKDFRVEVQGANWTLFDDDRTLELPLPALAGAFQLDNAATAIVALDLVPGLEFEQAAIQRGLHNVCLPGRFQLIRQQPVVIVDVAHNPQAAASLVAQLRQHQCAGETLAVVAMLADKPVAEVIELTAGEIDGWYPAGLESVSRGMAAADIAAAVEQHTADVKLCAASTVARACERALAEAGKEDRIIIFGSFHTVAEAMQFFARQG